MIHDKQRGGAWLLALALVPALTWAVPAGAQRSRRTAARDTGAQVVATVNGEKITRAQVFEEVMADQAARLNTPNPQVQDRQRMVAGSFGVLLVKRLAAGGNPVTVSRQELMDWLFKDNPPILAATVDNMILERAVAQEARKQGLSVTPAELKRKVADLTQQARTQFNLPPKMTEAQVLGYVGLRPLFVQRVYTRQLLQEKMMRKELAAKLGHAVGPGDFVRASHILVRVDPKPDAKPEETEKAFADARTKIQGYAEEIKSGKKPFEQAAQEYSDDSTKLKGGKLGVFLRGQMVPEFDKAVFSAAKGVVSEPVRTQFGWHLIRVDQAGAEVPASERDQALQNYFRTRGQALSMEIVQRAKVTNTISPQPQAPMLMPGGGQR